jgi:hypothetical protein
VATDLNAVMDRLGVALATIPGLRVFDFPPASAVPPFVFVDMPETLEYDLTYGRGFDRFTVEVFLGVGTQKDRVTRDLLGAYAAGGSGSIKQAIEAIPEFTAQVLRATFTNIGLAGAEYPGIVFTVDIAA